MKHAAKPFLLPNDEKAPMNSKAPGLTSTGRVRLSLFQQHHHHGCIYLLAANLFHVGFKIKACNTLCAGQNVLLVECVFHRGQGCQKDVGPSGRTDNAMSCPASTALIDLTEAPSSPATNRKRDAFGKLKNNGEPGSLSRTTRYIYQNSRDQSPVRPQTDASMHKSPASGACRKHCMCIHSRMQSCNVQRCVFLPCRQMGKAGTNTAAQPQARSGSAFTERRKH